jgi:hypothetical protein
LPRKGLDIAYVTQNPISDNFELHKQVTQTHVSEITCEKTKLTLPLLESRDGLFLEAGHEDLVVFGVYSKTTLYRSHINHH